MKRVAQALSAAALVLALAPASASAEFGLAQMDVTFTDQAGAPAMQAGSHPFAMRTSFLVNSKEVGGGKFIDGAIRDLDIVQAAGLAGNPTAVPRCETLEFLDLDGDSVPRCANSTALGVVTGTFGAGLGLTAGFGPAPVYNLFPSPGTAGRIGFWIADVPVTVELRLSPAPPYNVIASLSNTSQVLEVFDSTTTLWGNPADPVHDAERGACALEKIQGECAADLPVHPFLTLPRSCEGPLATAFRASSWWTGDPLDPGPPGFFEGLAQTHDDSTPPNPLGTTGCFKLGFAPRLTAKPTTEAAESPSGLEVSLEVDDPGLTGPSGIAHSDLKRAVVTLPEGVTANPSLAEGLATCSPQDLQRETLASQPGEGCPAASKIGAVEVQSPLLEGEVLGGALFIAQQDDPATSAPGTENPFDSLLALYIVIRHPELGILVKLAGKVAPDPETGQLITTFGDPSSADPAYRSLPQLPFSDFRLRFREGGRSPLISPNRCGTHTTVARFTPWADPSATLTATSTFQITSGVGGGPCPPAGTPPFEPGFTAGSLNNNAASHSPFSMRLTRRDGDQDLVRFDATLPPGVTAKLAGVSQCPDAAIAQLETKSGRQERANPSCPENSKIGTVFAGAGVGSQLTYVPGSVYLAGPFGGAPLSVVGVVPAVAGPFDVGVVSTRQALAIDPRTALVKVDSALSEPIPHILAGIPLKVRDIQVDVNRAQFTLNPTSCDPSQVNASIWGGGLDLFGLHDDAPVPRSARYQAANCSLLGFKPRLALKLKGGTKRGDHPALTAILRPRPGDANIAGASAILPRSEFLDQSHIRTICTRVQFAQDACPKAAIYGKAIARTPLLDFPVQGPVYLRSSDNELPDLVADLRGPASLPIKFELVGRTDSVRGGIRNTFALAPDVPVSEFVLKLEGAKKGLLVNSTDICARAFRAKVRFRAHNGKRATLRPPMRAKCGGKGAGKRRNGG